MGLTPSGSVCSLPTRSLDGASCSSHPLEPRRLWWPVGGSSHIDGGGGLFFQVPVSRVPVGFPFSVLAPLARSG